MSTTGSFWHYPSAAPEPNAQSVGSPDAAGCYDTTITSLTYPGTAMLTLGTAAGQLVAICWHYTDTDGTYPPAGKDGYTRIIIVGLGISYFGDILGYPEEVEFRFDEGNTIEVYFDEVLKATKTATSITSWAAQAYWSQVDVIGKQVLSGTARQYAFGPNGWIAFTWNGYAASAWLEWQGSNYCEQIDVNGGSGAFDGGGTEVDHHNSCPTGNHGVTGSLGTTKSQIEFLPISNCTPGAPIPTGAGSSGGIGLNYNIQAFCADFTIGAGIVIDTTGFPGYGPSNGEIHIGVYLSGVPVGYTPSCSAPLLKAAGNFLSLPCGFDLIPRGGQVHRRANKDTAWTAGAAYTTARALLVGSPAVHKVTLTDSTTKVSPDHGTTLAAGLAERLPTAVTYWRNATNGLTDGTFDPSDNRPLGVGAKASGSNTLVYAVGDGYSGSAPTETTVGTLTSAEVGGKPVWPVCWRSRSGLWRVGAFVNGKFYWWPSTDTRGVAWGSRTSQTLAATCNFTNCALALCRNARQLVAGYHATDGKIYAWDRLDEDATWQGPYLAATVASQVAPYAMQLPDGRLEVGWLLSGSWTLKRAPNAGGTWSTV